MKTFINLLGSDIWTDADITNKTEAIVREQFSAVDEAVLNRKVSGAAMGAYTLTPADLAEVQLFGQVTQVAGMIGVQARIDMALLKSTMDYEIAEKRLAVPIYDGSETVEIIDTEGNTSTMPNPLFVQDSFERNAASNIVNAATTEVLELVELRRPPVVEIIPTPEPILEP